MIGQTVNNYRIVSALGEGGMGAVYLAEHPFMGRKAAIKVLRREFAEDASIVERFMNEARAANAIRHPNIIDIIDVGKLPSGVPYLMMEYLDGESLAKRIERKTALVVPEVVDIVAQTAGALAAAHAKGIVHRDLKPDNLFLVSDPSHARGERVKVLDFGIAKLRGDLTGSSSAKTQTGSLMGTPPYMSPEQCRGLSDEIDHRTDVYALGIIAYEMLVGAPPFVSAGWGDILLMHITHAPEPLRTKNPDIAEALEAAVLRALAKAPAARFQSMMEMEAAFRAAASPSTIGVGALSPRSTEPMPVGGDARVGGTELFPSADDAGDGARNPVSSARGGRRSAAPWSAHVTTLKSAAGEMTTKPPAAGWTTRPGARRLLPAVAGALVVIGGGGAIAWRLAGGHGAATGDRSAAPTAVDRSVAPMDQTAAAPAPAAPSREPAAAPLAPPPAPEASPPAEVIVRLRSEPVGASIVEEPSGRALGVTPLDLRRARGEGALGLRLAKEGFAPARLSVAFDADGERTVTLTRVHGPARPRADTHVGSSPPAAREIGARAHPTEPAPAAASATPPPTAPTGSKSRAEKW